MASGDFRWAETVTENRYNERTTIHLRELLRCREDCNGGSNVSKTTLGSVLNLQRTSSPEFRSGKTLLDIIQADSTGESRKTWRYFREKLRLKRAGASWTSPVRIPVTEIERIQRENSTSTSNSTNNRMILPSAKIPISDPVVDSPSGGSISSRFHQNLGNLLNEEDSEIVIATEGIEFESTPIAAVVAEEVGGETTEDGGEEEGPVRLSLMELLAETDRELEVEGSAYIAKDYHEDEDGEDNGGNVEVGEVNNCCVCMIRPKGSAFIPCGHTFCRLCSRELWVQRGNCPICNGYILEILDIF